jgi:hypothetical protein
VTLNPAELVTGEHSGLKTLPQMTVDNPNLAGALQTSGISFIASDASRESAQRAIGNALTVPRYPMNIFYNVATAAEEVDEYNWIYTSRADGGSGICEDNPQTSTCIAPLSTTTGFTSYIAPIEVQNATQHLLGNDPRPHFAHQSNLTEDKILYPVLDGVLAKYNAAFAANTPLLHSALSESGTVLRQADLWRTNKAAVTAYAVGNTVTVQSSAAGAIDVPMTMPEGTVNLNANGTAGTAFGQAYAGERSNQVAFAASQTLRYGLPAGAGYPAAATVSAAPVIGTATVGNAPATVVWTAPANDGGSPITGYEVRVMTGTTQVGALRPADAGATSLAVTGLTNGTAYTFQVRALNAIGASAYSTISNAVTPRTVSAAPTIGTTTVGNASATAVWTAPTNNGGSAITGYEVRVMTGTTQVGALHPAAAGATSLAVTGLTNGTSYTVQVRALNLAGASAYSAMSNAVVPRAVPGAPTIGTATAGDAQATVKWTAPANTGGSPITSYTVRAYRLGAVVGTRTAASTARSLVLTGLGNGLSYSFTVAAVNAVGTSPFSATSNSVVPKGVSYAPVIGTATAGVASATARWTAPTNNGGSAITSYLVRTYRAGVLINTKQVAATARSLTLTALIKGQPHRFAVAAVNAIGTSGYSAQSNTVYPT